MGSNTAETVYIFLFLLTCLLTPQSLNNVIASKCVAIVATIFSLDRNGTLDFRFDILIGFARF